MNTSAPETQEHELPSEHSRFAFLKDLFSEGKFVEFWRHLDFSGPAESQSDPHELESKVPQRHKWSHSMTNVPATEPTQPQEPSAGGRPGSDVRS
jgi:hypothetical protein